MSSKKLTIGSTWSNSQGYYATILNKRRSNWILLQMSRLDQYSNNLINITKVWQNRDEFLLDFPTKEIN